LLDSAKNTGRHNCSNCALFVRVGPYRLASFASEIVTTRRSLFWAIAAWVRSSASRISCSGVMR